MENKTKEKAGRVLYRYGMRLRGFAPGCQPMDGFEEAEDDPMGDYWNILLYGRKLTKEERRSYDLDYLGERFTG
jgi:hypothetical protein